ncbi:MAG: ribonuclease III [Eubacteriales bacterium]
MRSQLEQRLGYTFTRKDLLENALSHSSYANEKWKNSLASNERLEFLGDSILGFVVAEYLYRKHMDLPEGDLTRIRADLVCETNLARVANKIGLGEFLLLGHGEEQGGGRKRNSILADAVESILAAAHLDGGFAAASGIVSRLILEDVPKKLRNLDFKTVLQELVQRKKNQILAYTLLDESGPDHDKTFSVQVTLNEASVGKGTGSSKKRAEQAAAEAALEQLFPNEY